MAAQAESVIRNIIREITLECSSRGETVSETLAAFMVKAAVLDPANEFNVERTLTKEDVKKLIGTCVLKLVQRQSLSLDTVKMQVHFDMNYCSRGEFLQEHRRVLDGRLQPVMMEILDARARSREELESLYRKIVSYVLLRSGLGSPTDLAVVREATAALQSVFPQTELGVFMALSAEDKQTQLSELTSIVAGIRLFNRDCGKGGEGIEDLPSILKDALKVTSENIEKSLQKSLTAAFQFTGVLSSLTDSPHPPPPPSIVLSIKEALINCRQYEAFIRKLMTDILRSAEHLDHLEADFQSTMESLKSIVQSKTAVPTSQVYPLFTLVSNHWSGYQDEVVLLSVLSTLLSQLPQFTLTSQHLIEQETMTSLLTHATCPTDDDRMKLVESEGPIIPKEHSSVEFLYPGTTQDFHSLPLQFKGYCGYTLAVHDRFLLPGHPQLGLLHYRGKYFAFSSQEAALAFASNPEKFISVAVDCSRRSPELIQLLDMHTHFSLGTPGHKGGSGMVRGPVTKSDAGTQTDTHFMESNIVRSYEWNEWELRRKAIKLANLRQKSTHSVQTDLSHYKRDSETQVYPPQPLATQTKRDSSTSVPLPSVYLAGLRGHETTPTSVDLTLPVDVHNDITS